MEISIKGIKVKHAEFIISLSIFKGTIDTEFNMNSYWLGKSKMRLLLLHFSLEIRLEHYTSC